MSAAIRKRVEAARKAYDKTIASIYALAPTGDTKFSECLALAVPELRVRHDSAREKLDDLERVAISSGKAWRGQFNLLFWYH